MAALMYADGYAKIVSPIDAHESMGSLSNFLSRWHSRTKSARLRKFERARHLEWPGSHISLILRGQFMVRRCLAEVHKGDADRQIQKGRSLEIRVATGGLYNTHPEFSEKFSGLIDEDDTILLYLVARSLLFGHRENQFWRRP